MGFAISTLGQVHSATPSRSLIDDPMRLAHTMQAWPTRPPILPR